MKSEYTYPCLLIIGSCLWLGLSLYFATSNWLRLARTQTEWGNGQLCQLSSVNTTDCRYQGRGGDVRGGCRLQLEFTGVAPIYVHDSNIRDGCTFRNCADARTWIDARLPEDKNSTTCWVRRAVVNTTATTASTNSTKSKPGLVIDNPTGTSRRDAVISTISATLAFVVIVITIFGIISATIKMKRSSL